MAVYRRENLGFVFQDFNLLDTFSIKDNIFLPLVLARKNIEEMKQRLSPLAELLGIRDILEKFPYEVSGGQKQRAASARALITNPRILFADEPTGALDSKSGKDLLCCLKAANEAGKATIVMVTHDAYCASYAKQVYFLKDGRIQCCLNRQESRKTFYDEIMVMLASMGGDRE